MRRLAFCIIPLPVKLRTILFGLSTSLYYFGLSTDYTDDKLLVVVMADI